MKMIVGVYKETLNKQGMFVDATRVRYECPGCGKRKNTVYGNYRTYKWKGLCLQCIAKSKTAAYKARQ